MADTPIPNDIDRLVNENQGLVRHLAQQVRARLPTWIEMEDLISYGQVGLLQAARDFDPGRGVKFSTFAFYRIRGSIFEGVNKLMWFRAIRSPETKVGQLADSVIRTTMDEATSARTTASDDMGLEASWFSRVTGSLAMVYLAVADEQGLTADVVDKSASPPWSDMVQTETSVELREAMNQLPPDAAALIRAIYYEDRTLQEAADRLGISKSWACRMHARALEQMARSIRQQDLGNMSA